MDTVMNLKTMPPVWLDKLRDIARDYDEDAIAVFVLHGSPERGLALSTWTAFEGDDALPRTVGLLVHALYDDEIDQPEKAGEV